eukprot:NODE_697_length_4659_cov_0.783991.p4 type:complete len:137 gc:universal NODE_697_length_4659_cov_0.783991:348-758(+)
MTNKLILDTSEITAIKDLCNSVRQEIKLKKRVDMQKSLEKLKQSLELQNLPKIMLVEQDTLLWDKKIADYTKELNGEEIPTLEEIRSLEKELHLKQEKLKKLEISEMLPLDKDLINLKIKEKVTELELLRQNNKEN